MIYDQREDALHFDTQYKVILESLRGGFARYAAKIDSGSRVRISGVISK